MGGSLLQRMNWSIEMGEEKLVRKLFQKFCKSQGSGAGGTDRS